MSDDRKPREWKNVKSIVHEWGDEGSIRTIYEAPNLGHVISYNAYLELEQKLELEKAERIGDRVNLITEKIKSAALEARIERLRKALREYTDTNASEPDYWVTLFYNVLAKDDKAKEQK